MKVTVHPADRGACGFYRLHWPAEELRKQGFDVVTQYDQNYRAVFQPSPFGDRIKHVLGAVESDVVVFQRPLNRQMYELTKALQDRGIAVVIEVDDDFSHMALNHASRAELDPMNSKDFNWDWLQKCCDVADWVTCTTPTLAAQYGRHGRVSVIPNYVPQSYLKITNPRSKSARRNKPIIGWTGSTHTHVGDLEVTKGAIADVLKATNAELHVVGTAVGVENALGAKVTRSTGWLPLTHYPNAYARFDIAIAPLKLSRFNHAKSNLKMLEAAALGVVPIGSRTGPYLDLTESGIGLIAESPEAWTARLIGLIEDHERRESLAIEYREAVRDRWLLEDHTGEWWRAWEMALESRAAA